ncbi:MAG: hypothetical protein LBS64_01140, partial [Spirochaetaceae bacterium]|nr:hypothetical protein [Spirochaetaceae bacterium]
MKVRVASVLLFSLVLLPLMAAPREQKLIFRASLGTAGIIYGSKLVQDLFEEHGGDMNRIVLALDAAAELALNRALHLTFGMENTLDYNASSNKYMHFYDYGFYVGIRFYPIPQRLSFSTEYILGQRVDFISIGTYDGMYSTPLGNGFRIGTELMLGYLTRRI